jgi:hypothetical protein
MKNLKHTFIALLLLVTSSCLKLTKDEEYSPKDSEVVPAAVESIVHNFNPNRNISLQGILDKYPSASYIYIGVKGVTGVSLSAEEARSVGQVTIGARGTAPYYDVVVTTPDGNIKTRIY